MAKNDFFGSISYEMENAWEATGNEQKISDSKEFKDGQIVDARVRDTRLTDGTVIKNVVFFMKDSKPRSIKLSPYNEQFASGTKVNIKSAVIGEYKNQDDELAYTVTCDEA